MLSHTNQDNGFMENASTYGGAVTKRAEERSARGIFCSRALVYSVYAVLQWPSHRTN